MYSLITLYHKNFLTYPLWDLTLKPKKNFKFWLWKVKLKKKKRHRIMVTVVQWKEIHLPHIRFVGYTAVLLFCWFFNYMQCSKKILKFKIKKKEELVHFFFLFALILRNWNKTAVNVTGFFFFWSATFMSFFFDSSCSYFLVLLIFI